MKPEHIKALAASVYPNTLPTKEQADAFVNNLPKYLYTEEQREAIRAELYPAFTITATEWELSKRVETVGHDAIDELVREGQISPEVAQMMRDTARGLAQD